MKKILFAAIMSVFALSLSAQDNAVTNIANQFGTATKTIRVPADYHTIQAAVDHAEQGDVVYVKAGTYKGAITLRDDVALIGEAAEKTILFGDRKRPVITGANGASVKHFTIENGYIGILCANTFMTIESCVIRGNKTSGIQSIIAMPIIKNNILYRNKGTGLYCETTRSHRGGITNNVIIENSYCGVMLAGQSEVLLENNVLYFNKQYGIFASDGARRSRIVHNLFFGNRQAGNGVAQIDNSNIFGDPGYAAPKKNVYAFWDVVPDMLWGNGRDGADIGLLKRSFYGTGVRCTLIDNSRMEKSATIPQDTAKTTKERDVSENIIEAETKMQEDATTVEYENRPDKTVTTEDSAATD